MNTNKVNFTKLTEAQDATKALAVNSGKAWTEKDRAYLKNHMFDMTIEAIAIALGRTAYSIETKFSKDPEFIELRKKKGDVPAVKILPKKTEEKQYFVSSDIDMLFGTGD
jgi:hypothetical protein